MSKPKILILCTGNSCRSHMAEGFLRHFAGDLAEVYSAGAKPAGYVHPQAIAAMAARGIELRDHTSKPLEPFLDAGITTVITVCDNAAEVCPVFPGKVTRHHWSFPDPPKDIQPGETEEQAFARIRDRIEQVFGAYAAGLRDGMADTA